MLPVQTVMIWYMVLVYRWGSGWPDAAGAWGVSWGGTVTGGGARWGGGGDKGRRGAAGPGREKAPPTMGSAGPSRGYT